MATTGVIDQERRLADAEATVVRLRRPVDFIQLSKSYSLVTESRARRMAGGRGRRRVKRRIPNSIIPDGEKRFGGLRSVFMRIQPVTRYSARIVREAAGAVPDSITMATTELGGNPRAHPDRLRLAVSPAYLTNGSASACGLAGIPSPEQ
jgi:hypothetical protein